ncbi:MAG: OPT/YSL family transporter [Patescibacteria group bacterium]
MRKFSFLEPLTSKAVQLYRTTLDAWSVMVSERRYRQWPGMAWQSLKENWRFLLLSVVLCAAASAATPYATLKLGMSLDLTYGGMFATAAFLGRHVTDRKELAVKLNLIQTMISVVSGIGFMVVILSAFFYIQVVFKRDIGFHPSYWQQVIWLTVSAVLGIFAGVWPRKMILRDKTLPWPTAKAVLGVAQTLTDPAVTVTTQKRRDVLKTTTGVAGFLTMLKDGFGVITPMVGNPALKMIFGLELAAIGIGMLVPLSVGLSGLLGVWVINTFGMTLAKLSALIGASPEYFGECYATLGKMPIADPEKAKAALSFLTDHCGATALEYLDPKSVFKLMVQWTMWAATAMMLSASLTSVVISVVRSVFDKKKTTADERVSMADERVSTFWVVAGTLVSAAVLIWITSSMFDVPWTTVLVAVAIQPLLIIAGLRVLGITGQGPVSLMTNATQFVYGLIWPAHIRGNLVAAYVSANPQALSETLIPSFYVAQRLGGKFKTLIIAGLIVIPIGALLTPLMFGVLNRVYGIGLEPGQLAAPTGLKIASLAIVMEKGLSALPYGALTASIVAIGIGILFEILLAVRKRDENGEKTDKQRFWWVPIPSALGFALILPPFLTLGTALGAVVTAVWRKFSASGEKGSLELFGAPVASGLIAGEVIVGAILLPVLALLMELIKPYL